MFDFLGSIISQPSLCWQPIAGSAETLDPGMNPNKVPAQSTPRGGGNVPVQLHQAMGYTGRWRALLGKQPCWLSPRSAKAGSPHVFKHCLLVLQSLGHIWNSNGKPLIWKVCQSLGLVLSSALVPTRFKVAFAIQSISRKRHNPYREWKSSFPTFPSRKWHPE